jgi:D-alanine-D-alanine ligase-like ATP-grasp enzyme/L-alanine-DL-glutamate epimerase-like enolase superfamily enzyme/acylphosphatase
VFGRRRSPARPPLRIVQSHVLEYTMPLKRPFGTARGTTRSATNFLIRLTGDLDGAPCAGTGEANPRGRLTGDDPEASWRFALEAVEHLVDRELPLTAPADAVAGVRAVMSDLDQLAAARALDRNRAKPYRGTLFGIEVALLDLVARAADLTVAQLLGQRRERVEISASTISSAHGLDEVERRLAKQLDLYPVTRLKGSGDLDGDLQLLAVASLVAQDHGHDRVIWIDCNEGMPVERAEAFVTQVASGMTKGELARRIIVEQPVPKRDGSHLPELQRRADEALGEGARALDLRLMPDESLWDRGDLERLGRRGAVRAVNIKAQKAGGLLPSLELAEAALARDPETVVYIGGMLGTSDITTFALRSLGLSLPRLDYMTAVPPTNVETRITHRLAGYREGTTILDDQQGPGLGTTLALEAVVPYVSRHRRFPVPFGEVQHPAGLRPNAYESRHLDGLGTLALDSHVLERETLAAGLETLRVSPVLFFAGQGDGRWPMGFRWTAATETARLAMAVTGNKQVTRTLLQRAGVPVPRGRAFPAKDVDRGLAYAAELGYPVVVKPLAGTGGTGVVANLTSEEDVRWAIEGLRKTKHEHKQFIVEEHIEGEDFRFFVLGDRVLSVLRRTPGAVIGDGELSVAELVLQKNEFRRQNPHLRTRPIKVGDAARFQLEKQGLTFTSVPDAGQRVVLTVAGNLSQGGDSIEVLDETHPSLLEVAVAAVRAIPGLPHAGVDFLVQDLRLPIDEQAAGICEINSTPGQTANDFPLYGPRRDVSTDMIRYYGERLGLPIAAPAAELTVRMAITGVVQGVGYRRWLADRADSLGLVGWVRNHPDGDLDALLHGSTDAVAATASVAITGPRAAHVETVHTWPTTEDAGSAFELREDDQPASG